MYLASNLNAYWKKRLKRVLTDMPIGHKTFQACLNSNPFSSFVEQLCTSFAGSYRWSKGDTEEVVETFKEWIHLPKGSNLPSRLLSFLCYSNAICP